MTLVVMLLLLLLLLQFFFPSNYLRIKLPYAFVNSLFSDRAKRLIELEKNSGGCKVAIDRDTSVASLSGIPEAVTKVKVALQEQLQVHHRENVEMKIPRCVPDK